MSATPRTAVQRCDIRPTLTDALRAPGSPQRKPAMTAIDPFASLASPTTLLLWRTLGQAYALWAKRQAEIAGFSWLWLLLMAAVFAVLARWQAPIFIEMMQAAGAGMRDPRPGATTLAQAITMLGMLPVLSSLAVAWHPCCRCGSPSSTLPRSRRYGSQSPSSKCWAP